MSKINDDIDRRDLFDNLKIAAPCTVNWDSMDGDERVRHCLQCNKNVYNISEMNQNEAQKFLQAASGYACIRLYKRSDGTVLLDNCPIGLKKLRAHYRKIAVALTTVMSLMPGCFLTIIAGETNSKSSHIKASKPKVHNNNITMGLPPPPPMAELSYQQNAVPFIKALMPKDRDLGHASLSLQVQSDGRVTSAAMLLKSPSKTTDELILKAVKNLKLPPLPKDITTVPLTVFSECK